jgi:hypothetical protein
MDNKGKIEKYVMTQRKDGYFFIDKNGIQNCEEKLVVCKNCLNWYNKQYRRGLTVESFDIADFFRHFKKTPITKKPTHTDIFAPKSGYTDDWDSISLRLKQQSGYICDDCRINLINHKKLVQTHHINGQKNDNRNSNLKVLCMECHSEQPDHGHMKRSAAHEILEVRRIKAQDPHFRVNRNAFR